MNNTLLLKVQELMMDVFDEESITLNSETTASDVKNWDSLNHVRLMVAIEQEFDIELPMEDVTDLKNVGELITLIESVT